MKSEDLSRRSFLTRIGRAAAVSAVATSVGFAFHRDALNPFAGQPGGDTPVVRDLRVPGAPKKLVVVRGDDPARMTDAALAELGGMGTFISSGDRVVIKPNIGWDRLPEQAANTNPAVVAAVVRACLAAGAASVLVTDVSCNESRRCFARSGIEAAAIEAGASVEIATDARFASTNMGGGVLGTQKVYMPFLEADKVINVPIAKHHSLTGATLAMKNLYGIIGGNRSRLHQNIHTSLADLGSFLRPTLTILDAWRVLRRNGPQGGNLADVEEMRMLIASPDPVAVDAWAGETIFGLGPDSLGHLALCADRGLGTMNHAALELRELTI